MTAHRSLTKSRRPLSSVPAGQPPGMRLSRRCRLSEAPNAIEGYGQPSSAITGQKKTLTFGPQVPENQHCPRQPLLNSEQHRSSRPKYRQKPALPSSAITELRNRRGLQDHLRQPVLDSETCCPFGLRNGNHERQQSIIVSHCWTMKGAGLQALDTKRDNNQPSSAIAGQRHL